MCVMDADLVGTSGFQLHPRVGMRTEALQHAVMADGDLAGLDHRHLLALYTMTADGRVDGAASDDHAGDDGLIDAADAARLELGNQIGVRFQGLGHHHQAGGVLVQAVHDAGARHIGQMRHVVQQRIEQGAVLVAGGGVNHQAGRLVDDQDMVIFIDDVQLDVLGDPFTLGLQRDVQFQARAGVDNVARTQHGAIDLETAVLDPASQAGTGVIGEELGGDLVETLTTEVERHFCRELDDIGHDWTRRARGLLVRLRAVVKYGVFVPGVPLGRPS